MVLSDAMEDHLKDFQTWLQDAGFQPDPNAKGIWNGSVYVEWISPDTGCNSVSEHKLSIILLPGFPYHAPIVVSRDDPPLAPSWHLAPGSPATLCLWDSQTGWRPHFTAQFLLNRIEDWLYNYHTDSWPVDSEVPDLHRYLEENEGLVVIGDEWRPPSNKKTGMFTFWRYQRFYKTLPCLAFCHEGGQVQLHIKETEPRLVDNLALVEKDIKRHSGVWFRLGKPFVPPDNLRGLLNHIDAEVVKEKGWASKACIHVLGRKLSDSGFPIALGYTDSRNQERWLFLWAQMPSTPRKKRQRIAWSNSENLAQVRIKSFQTAPARKEDLLRRSAYLSQRLSSRKAIVFGLGALGGSVAVLLAKAGISEIRLVDDDILLPGNVIRHVCGLNSVGFDKTIAVERSIRAHNPDCHVSCHKSTWGLTDLVPYT